MKSIVTFCPFCEAVTRFDQITSKLSGGVFYIRCLKCRGAILYPILSGDKLKKIYANETYFDFLAKPVKNPFTQWLLTRKIYETPIEWTAKNFSKAGKVLDIGCGNGEFLKGMEKEGWDVYGSDISEMAIRRTKERLNKKENINRGEFVKQNYKTQFDLISFWHVLEHTSKARLYVRKAYKSLKKGGFIVGELPNLDSLIFAKFRENYAWIMVPDHILYFSRNSLGKVLEDTGFHSIEIYSPPRALLNFALSVKHLTESKKYPTVFIWIAFAFSIPISIFLVFTFSLFGRGEVIRFAAQKSS